MLNGSIQLRDKGIRNDSLDERPASILASVFVIIHYLRLF